MVHVRHVIVRYRTSRRTSPYEPPYGTSSYGTVRVAAPEPTRRRTAPYESPYDDVRATVWHRTRHRMIPYEPPYVSVRCVVRCRTAARTVPYVGSYGHIATTWTCIHQRGPPGYGPGSNFVSGANTRHFSWDRCIHPGHFFRR